VTSGKRQSPLAHRAALTTSGGEIALEEVAFRGVLALRGERDKINAAAESAVGAALPASAGETATSGTTHVIWLAPDEWAILTGPGEAAAIADRLEAALDGVHRQVVDVSDYYTTIRVAGTRVREALAKLTAIDLHRRHFGGGRAISTNVGKIVAWIHCLAAPTTRSDASGDTFDLMVRRSQADYLWCMLADAGREWGLSGQEPLGHVRLHLPHFIEA